MSVLANRRTTLSQLFSMGAKGLIGKVNLINQLVTPVELENSIRLSNCRLINSSDGPISCVRDSGQDGDMSHCTSTFDFHQDGLYLETIPDLICLACSNPGRGDIPTVISDTLPLLQSIDSSERLRALRHCELIYIGKSGTEVARPFLEENRHTGQLAMALGSRCYLRPSKQPVHRSETPTLREIGEAVAEMYRILDASIIAEHYWTLGDILIVDNRRFVHGRQSSTPDTTRNLLRAWIGI